MEMMGCGQRLTQMMQDLIPQLLQQVTLPFGVGLLVQQYLPDLLRLQVSDDDAAQLLEKVKGWIAYVETGERREHVGDPGAQNDPGFTGS